MTISIHAPRTGSDQGLRTAFARRRFQSTLPARGATPIPLMQAAILAKFQSTLPARGATRQRPKGGLGNSHFNPRSPHGERHPDRGNDRPGRYFNPRSPHGERPAPSVIAPAAENISIHAPRTGSDRNGYLGDTGGSISIHAPRTGSDRREVPLHLLHRISIHAPRTGSDDGTSDLAIATGQFQSTLPARGATGNRCA